MPAVASLLAAAAAAAAAVAAAYHIGRRAERRVWAVGLARRDAAARASWLAEFDALRVRLRAAEGRVLCPIPSPYPAALTTPPPTRPTSN